MIHLEHLNLVVQDMQDTLKFYQAAFPHWKVRGGGESQWHGHPRNWLHFGDDYSYLTFNDNGTGKNRVLEEHQLGLAHFAFVSSDIKRVISQLKKRGILPRIDYEKIGARANVYFVDPSGFEVEFVQYFDDNPIKRNTYDT